MLITLLASAALFIPIIGLAAVAIWNEFYE